jgi:nicotinate-nucleotide pyrophosphorylase (carboxylating)
MADAQGMLAPMPAQQLITPAVLQLVDLALEEDLGRGDVTSQAVISPTSTAVAHLVARQGLTVAGLGLAAAVFHRLDADIEVETLLSDGDEAKPGATVATYRGSATALLAGERTALNFVQRLSGIATQTRKYVQAAQGSGLRITDTRKTTPGYRVLEKYAVRMGGGSNHRFDLGSGVLIKDNHLVVAGSVSQAIRQAKAHVPHSLKIEVEVDTLAQLDEALAEGVDIVLLDNFSVEDLQKALVAVRNAKVRPLIEVSGGVTLARIPELARLGVDLVSVGALTHSALAVDLALDMEIASTPRP